MGSFNASCALSCFDIDPGTAVRQVFVTQNPYSNKTPDPITHNDYWFCRTPPLKGKYDDYGLMIYDDLEMSQLIADVFSDDVVELPFGFNQYHEHAVRRGEKIHHYVKAAHEGRLFVIDEYTLNTEDVTPEGWPNWRNITETLRSANLPLQIQEDDEGYNVQPWFPGVVLLHFNSFDNVEDHLNKAANYFPNYDCKIIREFEDKKYGKIGLIIAKQGSMEDVSLLMDVNKTKNMLSDFSFMKQKNKRLSTKAIMIREDVWQAFLKVRPPIDNFEERIRNLYHKSNTSSLNLELLKHSYIGMPYQTSIITHLVKAAESGSYINKDELISACTELYQVEITMSILNHPWIIPMIGRQESNWKLQSKLMSSLTSIAKSNHRKLKQEGY